jgi:predicted metal-dependent phosphoesterase TrpH
MSAQQLVAQAMDVRLEVVAITDHDTTEAVAPAMEAARSTNLTIVPGVEVSTISGDEEIHILGYFVDLENKELQQLLARTREARFERAEKMLARLAGLGFPIEWDHLLQVSRGSHSIGRPHVATTMLKAGYVSSYDQAFDLWIGRGKPAYVERLRLPPEEAIQLIRWSQGLPVLAHPCFYSYDGECRACLDLARWLPRLRKAGLAGIEIYYPNYPRRASRTLLEQAVKHGLLITGGSDCHGGVVGSRLGSVTVPWAAWEGLAHRHELTTKKV